MAPTTHTAARRARFTLRLCFRAMPVIILPAITSLPRNSARAATNYTWQIRLERSLDTQVGIDPRGRETESGGDFNSCRLRKARHDGTQRALPDGIAWSSVLSMMKANLMDANHKMWWSTRASTQHVVARPLSE